MTLSNLFKLLQTFWKPFKTLLNLFKRLWNSLVCLQVLLNFSRIYITLSDFARILQGSFRLCEDLWKLFLTSFSFFKILSDLQKGTRHGGDSLLWDFLRHMAVLSRVSRSVYRQVFWKLSDLLIRPFKPLLNLLEPPAGSFSLVSDLVSNLFNRPFRLAEAL